MDITDKTEEFIFGVDLDGVCANFYEGIRPIAATWLGVPEGDLIHDVSYGFPEWGVPEAPGGYWDLHKFAVTQCDLFRILKPMSGCPQALRRLSKLGLRIRIITHRLYVKYFHKQAIEQTIDWLDTHGIPYWDLCFMQRKAHVGAHVYIEDSEKNILDLRNDGHTCIIFTNSTNRHMAGLRANTWDEVEAIVREQYAAWRAT
jgi:5'(3')-deoxyribonucleotidase